MIRIIIFHLVYWFCFQNGISAQTSEIDFSSSILKMDSLIFEETFNKCNFEHINSLLSTDFTFYHDQHGITQSKTDFITSLKENICSLPYRPRRELIQSSNKVFPLYNAGTLYGAIQHGKHKFYANEEGRAEYFTSIADFTHLWILQDQGWFLKSVLSYNHSSVDLPSYSEIDWNDQRSVEKWLAEKKVPCLGIGKIQNGVLSDVRVYGEHQSGKKAPFNTLFNVASLTKPIVSMTVLKLVEKGKWDLDRPLYHYWIDPDVANDPNHRLLTTRHILNHESGFVNWRSWHDSKKLTFDFEPGKGFNYSGEGFEYLRKALESKFNTTLEKIVNEEIFKPLGMNDSALKWNKNTPEERFAHWYDVEGKNTYKDHVIYDVNAADNMITTVADYGKFAQWVMNGAGLSSVLIEEMTSTHLINGQSTNMGLGWEIFKDIGGEYAMIHSGADRGVHCITILFPISKEGIVIMTNGDNGNQLYERIVKDHLTLGSELFKRAQ